MNELDAWLIELLKNLPVDTLDSVMQEIKAKLLESYRNGQNACPKCAPKARPVRSSGTARS